MYNIENMVSKIYDLLEKTTNMPNSILLNTAFTIVIDYFNHADYRSMWDVTDLCHPETIEDESKAFAVISLDDTSYKTVVKEFSNTVKGLHDLYFVMNKICN